MMKWLNSKDSLPAHQQEVLVRIQGNVNLAKFDKTSGKLLLRDGSSIDLSAEKVEWMELVAPGRSL